MRASGLYPPRRASLGNVFALPDPEDPDLPSVFDGPQWFVEILYADGRVERGLIARSEIAAADVSMYLYSFNIKAEDDPIQVDLLRSPTGHPSIDISAGERVHTRIIEPSADPVLDPIRGGRGYVANAGLALSQLCTPDVDCDHRRLTSTWRGASSQRHFDHEVVVAIIDRRVGGAQGGVDLRDLTGRELDVHHGAHHLYDFSVLHCLLLPRASFYESCESD